MTTTKTAHKIQWFVYVGQGNDRELIRNEASMCGRWAYELKCSCGWETKTGGCVRSWATYESRVHKSLNYDQGEMTK